MKVEIALAGGMAALHLVQDFGLGARATRQVEGEQLDDITGAEHRRFHSSQA